MRTTQWPEFRTGTDWQTRRRLRRDEIRRCWAEWLALIPWQAFVTLTFDPKRVFPVGRQRASREAFDWCNQAARILRRPIGWVYAAERGPSCGHWHSHVLVVGATAEVLRGVPGRAWTMRNGHITVKEVSDVRGMTLYATKSAAATGELVWSDTLARYNNAMADYQTVLLHP